MAHLHLDRSSWRYLPAGEWFQLLSGHEILVQSELARREPVVTTSIDLLGNITVAVCRPRWAMLCESRRTALIERHRVEVDRVMARLSSPEAAIVQLIATLRAAVWAAGLLGGSAVAWGNGDWLALLLTVLALGGIDATGLLRWAVAKWARGYVARLVRRHFSADG